LEGSFENQKPVIIHYHLVEKTKAFRRFYFKIAPGKLWFRAPEKSSRSSEEFDVSECRDGEGMSGNALTGEIT